MVVKVKRFVVDHIALLCLIAFYIPFHILLSTGYWDDAYFAAVLESYENNLIRFTVDRYLIWSSRLSIELLLPVLTALPEIVWKILNILTIILLYRVIKSILFYIFHICSKQTDFMLAILLCAYPFSTMAQTGWIATTTNYLWVVAFGGYAIVCMLRSVTDENRVTKRSVVSCGLAVLYSASYESMAAILFVVSVGMIIYLYRRKQRIPAAVWICLVVTCAFLIYILCCPGNRLRPLNDAETWMPDYFKMTFIDKLRVGIVSTFMHFVSIPSPIFFILNFLIFFSDKSGNTIKKIVAAMPLLMDIVWTGWFLVNYLLGYRVFTYQVPSALLDKGGDMAEQILLLISVLIWFAAMLYTLFQNIPRNMALGLTVILIIACAPEIAVGITPTVYASILRTTIYLYMAMIIMIMVVVSEKRSVYSAAGLKFLYFCMGCGMVLNGCQMIRHIMLYG